MVSRYHVAILSGVLSGCTAPVPPPKPGESDTASAPVSKERPVTSLREIQGEWDIVRFGDVRPTRLNTDGERRASLNIRDERLGFAIGCNLSGTRAQIGPDAVLRAIGDEPQIQTLMLCRPEQMRLDAAYFGFFGTTPRVSLTADGRLRLANERTELVLERPEVRRLANAPPLREITGRWIALSAKRDGPGGGWSGVGFGSNGHVLTIRPDQLHYSRCLPAVQVRYTSDARFRPVGDPPAPDCRFRSPTDASAREAQEALARVMRSGPAVERTAGGGLALLAGRETIVLRREEDVLNPPPLPPVPPGLRVAPPPPPPPPPPPR